MKTLLWKTMQMTEFTYYLIYILAYRIRSPEKTVGEMSQDIERLQREGWVSSEVIDFCLDYWAGRITVESIPPQNGRNAIVRVWCGKKMVRY